MTAAPLARSHTFTTLTDVGLPGEVVENAVLIVSELVSNALQHGAQDQETTGRSPSINGPELWIYRRASSQSGPELVIKVFDSLRKWRLKSLALDEPLAESGRGLGIINALTGGQWGHHPTRSRLLQPGAPGKAVWCVLPAPHLRIPRYSRSAEIDEAHATADLHVLLLARGINRIIRKSGPGLSVLSLESGLSIWCEKGTFRWRIPSGAGRRITIDDISEVSEQITDLHEAKSCTAHQAPS